MKSKFVFISNLLEENKNYLITSQGLAINDNFYKPFYFEYRKTYVGALVVINSSPGDCISKSGIIRARKQFLEALDYAVEELSAEVVLLSASTKRLFGKTLELRVNKEGLLDNNGFTLKEKYQNILFTNGDNGTSVILEMEIDSVLKKENVVPKTNDNSNKDSIIINGLGLLGTNSLEYLIDKQYSDEQVIVVSTHNKELTEIVKDKNVKLVSHISHLTEHLNKQSSNVKLIVNCTHHPDQILKAENLHDIQTGTMNVIDVAVPYGFEQEEYSKCKNIYRQDGGNAYIGEGLDYWFNPEILGLTENVIYGCFAEALAIGVFLSENPDLKSTFQDFDLFNVNKKSKKLVNSIFNKYNIGIAPVPYNYMVKAS